MKKVEIDYSLFTVQEIKVLDHLATAWNEYIKLPKQHNMEVNEMCSAIHRCQDLVLIRASRKKVGGD